MSPKPAPPHTWRSGHCGIGRHGACRGAYAGAECSCRCHRTPEPVAAVSVDPGPAALPAGLTHQAVGMPVVMPSLLRDGSQSCPHCGRPWVPLVTAVRVEPGSPLAVAMDTGGASGQW